MIDTHAHLTDPKFIDVTDVIKRASEVGVDKIIVPATDAKDMFLVKELTVKYENVYGLVGIYPGNVEEVGDLEATLKQIEELVSKNEKIVGIGEIGLDCYWNDRDIEKQKVLFKAQLELAIKLRVPVAIHSRKAEREIKEVFEEMKALPKGQFHCFGESRDFLSYILDKDYYVSFCGNITYKSADNLRRLVKLVPLERLLLETDSPYLAPEGQRGRPNEPANVRIIGEYIASLRDVSLETLINQTTANAKCLFFGG